MTTETNQLEKQVKPKRIKIFNTIDLTKAVKKAAVTEEKHKRIFKTKVKKSKSYVDEPVTVTEASVLETSDSSVQRYIEECHPDVKKFIKDNKPSTITAKAGELIVVTKNDFRIQIKTISKFKRHVKITDNRKKVVLFNDVTICQFKKVENVTN